MAKNNRRNLFVSKFLREAWICKNRGEWGVGGSAIVLMLTIIMGEQQLHLYEKIFCSTKCICARRLGKPSLKNIVLISTRTIREAILKKNTVFIYVYVEM